MDIEDKQKQNRRQNNALSREWDRLRSKRPENLEVSLFLELFQYFLTQLEAPLLTDGEQFG